MKTRRASNFDYDDIRLISRALDLYYRDELTQTEVGKRLGLSAAKVNRLLKQARREGMVKVTIHTPLRHLFDLESRLKAIFNLRDAVVIPRIGKDVTGWPYTLGAAGASYLLDQVRDGDIIGVGGGTGVHAVVQAMASPRKHDVEVVPILGAVQGGATTDVNNLAAQLAERLGGKAYRLPAPAFVDSRKQRDLLLSMGPIKKILDIARQANLVLMGVGSIEPSASRYVEFTVLSPGDMNEIASSSGGVGEIAARVYDLDGRPCAPDYAGRVVGLTLHELRSIPFAIGVAATTAKVYPLYGALRGCHLHSLITDEAAARGLLELFDRGFRPSSSECLRVRPGSPECVSERPSAASRPQNQPLHDGTPVLAPQQDDRGRQGQASGRTVPGPT
jgi:DNA-binding transcriptional regulator LsrR (DeoR family)